MPGKKKTATRRTFASDVPYVSPTTITQGVLTWDMGDGVTVVRHKDGTVSMRTKSGDVSTMSARVAMQHGKQVLQQATTDKEQLWGQVLCSAATQRRK